VIKVGRRSCAITRAIVACDLFVVVTVTFRLFYVLVLIEYGWRRLAHFNISQHPTAAWTLQQLPEAIGCGEAYRYLFHDRDSIFARSLDESIRNFRLTVLKSPPNSPKANANCERVIGTTHARWARDTRPGSERIGLAQRIRQTATAVVSRGANAKEGDFALAL